VQIVDSAATTAQSLLERMLPTESAPRVLESDPGRITWLATDDAERFARVGGQFFGRALSAEAVEIVDL
jgi:glutamate racemase